MRRKWLILGVVCTLTIAIAAGTAWYWRVQHRPPEAEVGAYLAKSLEPMPVQVAAIEVGYGRVNAIGTAVTYHAVFETTAPLFRRIDTGDYLRRHAAAEMAAIDEASVLLRGPNADRVRTLVGPAPSTFELVATSAATAPFGRAILVVMETPPRSTESAAGTLLAWREAGAWRFTGEPVNIGRTTLAGEPKPVGAFAIDVAEDAARFRALIAECAAYAAKVRTAAESLEPGRPPIDSSTLATPLGDRNPAMPATRSAPAESAAPPPTSAPTPANNEPLHESLAAPTRPTDAGAVDSTAALPKIATPEPSGYVLTGQWLPLPRNNPQVTETGGSETADATSFGPVAWLTFDGHYYVPAVSGEHVVLAYVGSMTWSAQGGDSAPPIALARETLLANGTRAARLHRIAPDRFGFGSDRVPATVERTTLRVIGASAEAPAVLLRCAAPVPPGRYALYCGRDA